MTPEEFVKEVNSSEVMPHDFENMYKEFQGYQKKEHMISLLCPFLLWSILLPFGFC